MSKRNSQNMRRNYKYPETFENAKIFREAKVREYLDLKPSNPKNKDLINKLRQKIKVIDHKIDCLELLFESVNSSKQDIPYFKVIDGLDMEDFVYHVIIDDFDYTTLVPLKNNIDYLSALYLLLYGDNAEYANSSIYMISSQIDYLFAEYMRLLSRQDNHEDVDEEMKSLKDRIMTFIIVFAGHISIEEIFKNFDFTQTEILKIISTYILYQKSFDWFEYFIGRYYAEYTRNPLFDLESIEIYLRDIASYSEKEEFDKCLMEFIERLDKEKEISVNENRLYDISYKLGILSDIMSIIEDERNV